jgi:hypothetical protein
MLGLSDAKWEDKEAEKEQQEEFHSALKLFKMQ